MMLILIALAVAGAAAVLAAWACLDSHRSAEGARAAATRAEGAAIRAQAATTRADQAAARAARYIRP